MSDSVASSGRMGQIGWSRLDGEPFAVLGMGRSGIAAANALVVAGADVVGYDDRDAAAIGDLTDKLHASVRVRCGGGYIARPGEICVVSPGIAPHTATFRRARASASAVIGEVELFYRLNQRSHSGEGNPIVAISGTDGKTTTAMMIAHVLRVAGHDVCLAGNIGTPLTEVLPALRPSQWIVAEVSAFQLFTCAAFRPRVAVLTNVADDHVDWFSGDRDAYAEAKCAVARRCGPGDTVVFNADDPAFSRYRDGAGAAATIAYSVRPDAPAEGAQYFADSEALQLRLLATTLSWLGCDEIGKDAGEPLIGRHNAANALAAAAATQACGVPLDAIARGLRSFVPAPHRLSSTGTIGGVRFVNDSKATNPHAALAGLKAVSTTANEQLVWIGGGSDKQADFSALASELQRRGAICVLIGATTTALSASLTAAGVAIEQVHACDDLHAAVSVAFGFAQPAGCVLLSPACASFGLFRSYSHRGDVFIEAVAALRRAIER